MKKPVHTGYGRRIAQVLVLVDKPFYKEFVDSGWEAITQDDSLATFVYECSNRYEGDDESIVHALWGDLPSGVNSDSIRIDWEESVY